MNTTATTAYRRKYRLASLETLLRNALVCEKICKVDRSDAKYIDSPYGSQPTVTIQSVAGTYTPAAYTTTNDTLTVTDEFIVSEHIYDFEKVLNNFDIWASRIDEQNAAVADAIDKFVLNNLCEDGTGTYTTPGGGFTTAANVPVILANLASKVAGYANADTKGLYLVIESGDLVGFIQYQMAAGFNYADSALKNGFLAQLAGIDIYVVRAGRFVSTTLGTKTVTNSGHRVFGVKGAATYAAPRGIQYDEKGVTQKTGKEIVTWGYVGFKLWKKHTGTTIDITIA